MLAGAALAGPGAAGGPRASVQGCCSITSSGGSVVDGAEVTLTFQEFELLAFLAAHPATVFSRADLVQKVWQRDFTADSRTVDVHVSRLRRKLGPAYGRCLVTEYRVGYQFRPSPLTSARATQRLSPAVRSRRSGTLGIPRNVH